MDILSIHVAKSVIIPRGRLDLDLDFFLFFCLIAVWGNALELSFPSIWSLLPKIRISNQHVHLTTKKRFKNNYEKRLKNININSALSRS